MIPSKNDKERNAIRKHNNEKKGTLWGWGGNKQCKGNPKLGLRKQFMGHMFLFMATCIVFKEHEWRYSTLQNNVYIFLLVTELLGESLFLNMKSLVSDKLVRVKFS